MWTTLAITLASTVINDLVMLIELLWINLLIRTWLIGKSRKRLVWELVLLLLLLWVLLLIYVHERTLFSFVGFASSFGFVRAWGL